MPSGNEEASALIKSAKDLIKSNPIAALEDGTKALEMYKQLQDMGGLKEALKTMLASKMAAKVRADEAVKVATQQLDIFKGAGDKKGIAAVLHVTAEFYSEQLMPEEVEGSAKQAQNVFVELGDSTGAAQMTILVVSALLTQSKIRDAVKMADEGIKLLQGMGDKKGEAAAWYIKMNVCFASQRFAEATKAGKAAETLFKELGDIDGEALSLKMRAQAAMAKGKYPDAIDIASTALTLFRSQGDAENELSALDIIVQSNIAMNKAKEAVNSINSALVSFRASGNKSAEGSALMWLVNTYVNMESLKDALRSAKEAQLAFKAAADQKKVADSTMEVAKISGLLGRLSEAELLAGQAVKLYQEIGDAMGAQSGTELLSEVRQGKEEATAKKKVKEKELDILDDLAKALDKKDGPKFQQIWIDLKSTQYLEQQDFDDVIGPIMKKDPEGCQEFLEEFGEQAKGPAPAPIQDKTDGTRIKAKSPLDMYYMITWGGMNYGPHFRLVRSVYRKGPLGDPWSLALASLRNKSGDVDWSMKMNYHPGIKDCALQAGLGLADW